MKKRLLSFVSRKFVITLLSLLLCFILVLLGKMSDVVFKDIVIWILTIYAGSNVIQKYKDIGKLNK